MKPGLIISSAVKTAFLAPFPALFNGGAIYCYDTGTRPASPDMAALATPAAIITHDGLNWFPNFTPYGLTFRQQGPNILFGNGMSPQLRPLRPIAALSWWRLVAPGDDGSEVNYDAPRIDGDIGLKASPAGEQLLLATVTPALGTLMPVGFFIYTIPPL